MNLSTKLIVTMIACLQLSVATAEFKAYDMSGLSWLPPSLTEAGYEKVPVLFMCHMWNGRYGHERTNCDDSDFSSVNHEVVRQRAGETLGAPIVVIDIERTTNPTSEGWHMLSDDPEVVLGAVALWQELIATFREVNADSKILIYKPMPRIWWPLAKNEKFPLLQRGQADIDTRYETAKLIAPLFDDKSLMAWPSAYQVRDTPEIMKEERKWLMHLCNDIYETECIFAMTPWYQKLTREDGSRKPVSVELNLEIMNELRDAGAAGFGFWLPHRFDNERYLDVVRGWEEDRASLSERQASNVNWLTAIEAFLAQE